MAQPTAFVTLETEFDKIKRKNLHYVSAWIGFVWMLFHFTVVFFFALELKSPLLVGIFLGLGNLISLMLDVPVGILSKYFPSKRLFLFAGFSMLLSAAIFLKFMYASTFFTPEGGGVATPLLLLTNFLDSFSNLLLLALAAWLYGFTKEVNDLTTLSYILNNADPSEYAKIISKNNIFVGAGSLFGLIASGFVLSLNHLFAIIILILCILTLIAFIFRFFDANDRTITLADVVQLKVVVDKVREKWLQSTLKDYSIGYIQKAQFSQLAASARLIFLRPKEVKNSKEFSFKALIPETKIEFHRIKKVIMNPPANQSLVWFIWLVLSFGFWDTFAASFLIDFLANESGSKQLAYILLGAIAIPAFVLQDFFIGLSRRIWRFIVMLFWILLSGFSIIVLGFVGWGLMEWTFWILVFWLLNSVGYAAGMWLAQGGFLELYNSEYAKKQDLREIESNASASPMKIIQNLANVIGLTLGWFFLALFWYSGFFIVFGWILIGIFCYSIMRKTLLEEV
jgi:MFS family permease